MSRWRERAKAVIAKAAEYMASGLEKSQVEALLRPHYPFGERKGHPYRMWLKEVKEFVERYLGRRPPVKKPSVRLAMCAGEVVVRCGWCRRRNGAGCLACLRARAMLEECLRDPVCAQIAKSVDWGGEEVDRNALIDFVQERTGMGVDIDL